MSGALQGADRLTALVAGGIVAVFFLVVYGIQTMFLWRTAKGWGGSRLVVLTVLCAQVMNQLVTWITLPEGALPVMAVVATALFVMAIYALTTPSVATWTTAENRKARQRRSAAAPSVP